MFVIYRGNVCFRSLSFSVGGGVGGGGSGGAMVLGKTSSVGASY